MTREADRDWPPIEFTVAADSSRVSYRLVRGTGTPFLYVRNPEAVSLSLSPRIMGREACDRFRRGRTLIVFDWRGSGESDPIEGELTIEQLGLDLDAAIDVVGEPVDAVASGRSSFAVVLHAARRPERYRSITIVDGMVRSDESFAGFVNRPGWQSDFGEHLRGLAAHSFQLDPDETARFALLWERAVPSNAFAAYLESERDIDLTDVLPTVEGPTWVIARLPIDHEPARKLALLLPDSHFSIYPASAGRPPLGGWSRDQWDTWSGEGNANVRITPREGEVLQLVASGDTNKQIAEALVLSPWTAQRHVSNLLRKTGLANRRQLMRFADRRGEDH